MNSWTERNLGRHKTELLFGLCSDVSARLVPQQSVTYNRLAAAFKYLFAHMLTQAFISTVRQSCQACNNIANSQHSCTEKIGNRHLKLSSFYSLMQTIDRMLLRDLFKRVTLAYCSDISHVCSCILFYKCKTTWRPLMRKQFLDGVIPRGLDKKLLDIILCELGK